MAAVIQKRIAKNLDKHLNDTQYGFRKQRSTADAVYLVRRIAEYGEPEETPQVIADLRKEWIRRFRKFAQEYFNGNLKRTEYCFKDIDNLYSWNKIKSNFKPIDFTALEEKEYEAIDTMGAQACSGGACELEI